MFKESFKYYKSKCDEPDLSTVIDFDDPIDAEVVRPYENHAVLRNVQEGKSYLGVLPPQQWKIYELIRNPGLLFIKNPFTYHGQRYWIAKCCRDYPRAPHAVNLSTNKSISKEAVKDWWKSMQLAKSTEKIRLKNAMRWATLGYHHDWDSKVYTEQMKHEFPHDLATLSCFIAGILGFDNYSAEAAIVNFYPIGTTLAGHTDHSEKNLDAPLFSYSFGQKAIFLIGGQTTDIKPSAIFLKSGDIVVMSRQSRLSYHAVPRIMKDMRNNNWNLCSEEPKSLTVSSLNGLDVNVDDDDEIVGKRRKFSEPKLQSHLDMNLWNIVCKDEEWIDFEEYIQDCRININVRQVLHQGQLSLCP